MLAGLLIFLAVIVTAIWIETFVGDRRGQELSFRCRDGARAGAALNRASLVVGTVRVINLLALTDSEYNALTHTYHETRWCGFVLARGRFIVGGSGMRGFGIKSADDHFFVGIPTPLAIALLAAFPVLHWRRIKRATHRRRNGLCPSCGYDIRATPECCPECGATSSAEQPRPLQSQHAG